MLRIFYPELLHDEPELLQAARAMASRVYEFSEFTVDVLGKENLGQFTESSMQNVPRKVTYHESCHLRRELGALTQARMLIRALPGVELVEMEQAEVCCGFGGTFSLKYSDISGAMLNDKIDNIRRSGAETLVTCDSGCLAHIAGGMDRQGVKVRSMHLAQLLEETLGPT